MTETGVLTLSDFLLARIAEDEEVARKATPGPWEVAPVAYGRPEDGWGDPEIAEVTSPSGTEVVSHQRHEGGGAWIIDAEHIARWDPARVLAECASKRRIVENARNARRAMGAAPLDQLLSAQDGPAAAYWRGQDYVLRLLAQPYADHPDYRQEWSV